MSIKDINIGDTLVLVKVPHKYKKWATRGQECAVLSILETPIRYGTYKKYVNIKVSDALHAYGSIAVRPQLLRPKQAVYNAI